MSERAVVYGMVVDYLLYWFLIDSMVIYNSHTLRSVELRNIRTPLIAIAELCLSVFLLILCVFCIFLSRLGF